MKIALPTRDDSIDSHFGHCEYYTVYTVSDSEITGEEIISSPPGCGCKSNIASVLAGMDVSLMLAGNMGDGAVNVLRNSGIEVVRGCEGLVKDVALAWISGTVSDSKESCHEHECNH